ncbi:MAG: DUF1549 and DUF1553 domain-containing protein [Verrucomicrobia bacterium]|nr:DUF1549 and DUF1553 domain-containing protein [Verrucomicrobiota bacterium]
MIPMKGLNQHSASELKHDALKTSRLDCAQNGLVMGTPLIRLTWVLILMVGTSHLHADETKHWAFQPITHPVPPYAETNDWAQNNLDLFVLDSLRKHNLLPSPKASKRELIRRAYLDLTGLPPSFDDVKAFEQDEDPDAFQQTIDRLLNDSSYGKHWGRHWLDVARYADAKGYVDAGEPTYPFAYTYRDYVVDAFNHDKPFAQFVMEQIAADRLPKPSNHSNALAGLGFLTVGSRFNFFPHEIIDDRIDVVTRGFLGLTVTCARCHDHKYDPVTSEDYYALYGVFMNSREPVLDTVPVVQKSETSSEKEWKKSIHESADAYRKLQKEQHERVMFEMRAWAKDYLNYIVQTTPRHRTQDQPDLVTERGMIREVSAYAGGAVKPWRRFLETQTKEDPVFGLWAGLYELDGKAIPSSYAEEWKRFKDMPNANQLVVRFFNDRTVGTMADAAEIYGTLLEDIDTQWRELLKSNPEAERLVAEEKEAIRAKLYGPDAPATIRIDEAIDYLTLDESVAIRKAHAETERVFLKHWQEVAARPMMLEDRDQVLVSHVFHRGDPDQPGDPAPRSIPAVLGATSSRKIEHGSGRLELAELISDPDNPLAARVWVNRIWNWHFGRPLVATPSDFGVRSQPPIHAQLLDYLASFFLASGGSSKELHRLILGSATWQQSSKDRAACRAQDPDNNLLWRMNRRRLTFETVRDSMLQVADKLKDSPGGPPLKKSPQDPENNVRTIYNYIDREDLDDVFRIFDFPSPDISAPHRTETNVPQQALFLLNSPFVLSQAKAIIGTLPAPLDAALTSTACQQNLKQLFHLIYQRDPAPEEYRSLENYLKQRIPDTNQDPAQAWSEIAQTLLLSNEFQFLD